MPAHMSFMQKLQVTGRFGVYQAKLLLEKAQGKTNNRLPMTYSDAMNAYEEGVAGKRNVEAGTYADYRSEIESRIKQDPDNKSEWELYFKPNTAFDLAIAERFADWDEQRSGLDLTEKMLFSLEKNPHILLVLRKVGGSLKRIEVKHVEGKYETVWISGKGDVGPTSLPKV